MANARRIDVHIHIVPPFYAEAALAAGAGPTRGSYPDWSPEAEIRVMDDNGIEIAVNSVVPGVHFLRPEPARTMARRCNEFAAELSHRFPSRFGAFALIPMHDPEHAVGEISYALDVLKHDGVCLMSSYGDSYLGDPVFDPVLEELNQRKAVAFIHPFNPAQLPGAAHSTKLPYPAFMIEYPFDTTRVAAHLILSGAIKRYSDIKFILAHAGGTLPYLAWRIYACQMVSPKFAKSSYEEVKQGLKHFWYDTAMSAGPEMMECLIATVGSDRILFGSDWPFGNSELTALCDKNLAPGERLSQADAAAIARRNALKLFPRLEI